MLEIAKIEQNFIVCVKFQINKFLYQLFVKTLQLFLEPYNCYQNHKIVVKTIQ